MQNSGFGLSAFLVATGAILAWAITIEVDGVDLNQVGLILLGVGLVVAFVTTISVFAGQRTTVESETQAVVDGQQQVAQKRDVVTQR